MIRHSTFVIRHSLLLLALFTLSACTTPPGEIFPPTTPPLLYPPPPETPRIQYIGQLITSADLKPPVPFLESVGQALFGKKPVQSMLSPYALCTDGRDRLFIADSNLQAVHVFDLKTRKYARWQPAPPLPRFSQPVGIAWNPQASRLYVADSVNAAIYVFDASGKSLTTIGPPDIARPTGLAVDPANSRLYVTDTVHHQVFAYSTTDHSLLATLGSRGEALGQFNFPTNVAVDSQSRLYVSDSLNFRIQQFSPDLKPLKQIGRKGDVPGYFGQPKGVALDSQDHLYVVDAHFEAVQIFDADSGAILLSFGAEGRKPGEFWLPAGIFIDPADRIWIADTYNRRIQVFQFLRASQP